MIAEGLRPHIVNWSETASLVLERVERAHHAHLEDEDRRALFPADEATERWFRTPR